MNDARAKPRVGSLLLFLAIAAVAVALLVLGHGYFPGARPLARAGRLLCSTAAIGLLILVGNRLLRRDGFRSDALGLAVDAAHARAFLIGACIATVHILLLLGVFYAMAPFDVERGPRSAADVAWAAADYVTGNFIEELLFRGYLLIVLARWLGITRAVALLALPFGLFHFPGLDAEALVKMMLKTGAMHFVYAYAFLGTRSLWAAVALHAVGNTLLHEVVGVNGPAVVTLRYSRALPDQAPFLIFFFVTAVVALLCSRWVAQQPLDPKF